MLCVLLVKMAEQLSANFTLFITAMEKEIKTLKSITNLRVLEDANGALPKDVVESISSLERRVDALESKYDEFDRMLDSELAACDSIEALMSQANQQKEDIERIQQNIPSFLRTKIAIETSDTKEMETIDNLQVHEFEAVPGTTRGRLTFQQVFLCYFCF